MQQTIRVAAAEPPYILYDPLTDTWSGAFVIALRAVCKRMDFRCDYLRFPKNEQPENATLDGPLGAVFNGSADVALVTTGITSEKYPYFEFIHSFSKRTYSVVIHQDNLLANEPSGYILRAVRSLYTDGVWLGLLAVFLCSLAAGILMDWFHFVLQGRPVSVPRLVESVGFRIFGIGLGLGGIDEFSSDENKNPFYWPRSKCVFCVTFLIYSFVILSTVNERLSVLFSLEKPGKLPFSDTQSLVASDFTIYATMGVHGDVLNNSKAAQYHKELALKLHPIASDIKNLTYYDVLVKSSRNALIVNENTLLKISQVNCELITAIDAFAFTPIACLAMAKNSSFREKFVLGYAKIAQEGIMERGTKMLEDYIRSASRPRRPFAGSCFHRMISPNPKMKTVGNITARLDNFVLLYLILFGAFGLSLGVLVCEMASNSPYVKTKFAQYLSPFPFSFSCRKTIVYSVSGK